MPATATHCIARELDRRVSDGIEIRLLWHPHDDHVSVTVSDAKTGDAFSVPVPAGERAMDVFHHPYAYVGTPVLQAAA
jgi:hypothetical protein